MQWEKDLIKDIRFHDGRDEIEAVTYVKIQEVKNKLVAKGEMSDFSSRNRESLKFWLNHVIDMDPTTSKVFLEIGTENNVEGLTSTSVFFEALRDQDHYFGVDVLDRSFLETRPNIHTIQCDSSLTDDVVNYMTDKLKITLDELEIDFLFIDGWHSINQVLKDWEFSKFVKTGIVGFHDVNYHLGPNHFTSNLNSQWYVKDYPKMKDDDFGVTFVWRTE